MNRLRFSHGQPVSKGRRVLPAVDRQFRPAFLAGLTGAITSDNKFYLLRARPLRWVACSATPRQRCPAPAGLWACIGGLGQALRAHFGLRRRRHKPKRQGKTRVVGHSRPAPTREETWKWRSRRSYHSRHVEARRGFAQGATKNTACNMRNHSISGSAFYTSWACYTPWSRQINAGQEQPTTRFTSCARLRFAARRCSASVARIASSRKRDA